MSEVAKTWEPFTLRDPNTGHQTVMFKCPDCGLLMISDRFCWCQVQKRPRGRMRARIAELEAVLQQIVDSDMAMREEDEGQTSQELAAARTVLSARSEFP